MRKKKKNPRKNHLKYQERGIGVPSSTRGPWRRRVRSIVITTGKRGGWCYRRRRQRRRQRRAPHRGRPATRGQEHHHHHHHHGLGSPRCTSCSPRSQQPRHPRPRLLPWQTSMCRHRWTRRGRWALKTMTMTKTMSKTKTKSRVRSRLYAHRPTYHDYDYDDDCCRCTWARRWGRFRL